MQLSDILDAAGFTFEQPRIHWTNEIKLHAKIEGISSMNQPFIATLERQVICCKHPNQSVLWEFDMNKRCIILSNKACKKLYSEDIIIVRRSKVSSEAYKMMIEKLCFNHFFIQTIVFEMEGNWLMQQRNLKFHGLVELCWLYLTQIQLESNQMSMDCFHQYLEVYHDAINLKKLDGLNPTFVLHALLQCFLQNSNELSCFSNKIGSEQCCF